MKKIEKSVEIFAIIYFSLIIANLIVGNVVSEDNILYVTMCVILFNPVSIICGVAAVAFFFYKLEKNIKKIVI